MKILATFGIGLQCAKLLSATMPSMLNYAERHNYVFFRPDESDLEQYLRKSNWAIPYERPPSWYKLPLFLHLFQYADQILWLDADVLVMDPLLDIANQVGDKMQGLVWHYQKEGPIPNCGVWFMNKSFMPYLRKLWERVDKINHPWWEQGALLSEMGGGETAEEEHVICKNNRIVKATAMLNNAWNWTHYDEKKVDTPFFAHATGRTDRLEALERWKKSGKVEW